MENGSTGTGHAVFCSNAYRKNRTGTSNFRIWHFLTAVGYDGALKMQAAGTLSGITEFFKVGPLMVMLLILVLMCFWNLDRDLPDREDLKKRGEKHNVIFDRKKINRTCYQYY